RAVGGRGPAGARRCCVDRHPLVRWESGLLTTTLTATSAAPGGAAAEPVVQLRDVFCVHRTSEGDAAALQGTTLSVAAGELLCVLGPSGAGKSTLLRVVAGLQTPSAGVVQ